MKFGVFDHLDRGCSDLQRFYEDRLSVVEAYDKTSLYAYHVAEHHGTLLGMAPSPGIYLSAVAQRTRRLRFGPMVYCLPLYNPIRLLEEICMLDQLSGGRLELGVGRGISPIEAEFYEVDAETGQARYQEALDFILAGLKGSELTFDGEYYRTVDFPIALGCVQQPHPPLWYGVARPQSADWAAENSVNVICNQPADVVRHVCERYRARWNGLGRDESYLPLLGVSRHVVIAEDGAEARRIASRAYQRWYDSFMSLWRRHGKIPQTVSFPDTFDELMKAGLGVAGTPDEVHAFIRDQLDVSNANYFVCRFCFGDLTAAESIRSVQLFDANIATSFMKAA